MKKQNSNFELNNFHLQLYSLEQQQQNINVAPPTIQHSFLYKIQYFPISISITSSLIYFSFFLLWFINLLDSYLYCYSVVYHQDSVPLLHTIISLVFDFNLLGYIINGILLLVIAVSFIFHYQEANEGIFYFFWYFGSKSYHYLRYFIEGLFFLTSYFAINADMLSLIFFSISCLFSCFYTIFLQNITLRKDEFCCKSLQFSILFRITLIISLIINIISVNQVFTTSEFIGCTIGQLILALNLLICYFSFGITTYRHKAARFSLFFMVTIYFAFIFSFFIDILATIYYSYSSSNVYLIFVIIFIVLEFFLISSIERLKRASNHPSNENLKNKIFFSFNKYEHADEDQEIDCEIRGVLHQHYTRGCKNLECIANIKEVYDSKKKKKCSINKIAQGKVSVIKFYVKCLYETALREDENNIHLQLDYIEFYYLKLKNVFIVLKKITELQHHYLTFYQKLRLTRIKEFLIKESNDFSKDLYHKSLSMCKVIGSEQTFLKIQKLIDIILARNGLFWKYLSFNEVHLKEIIKIVEPNFRLLDQTTAQWGLINQYFYINRRWKFYYICFTIFIKNEKIKPSMIEDFGNSVQYDSIFKTDNYFVDKTTQKELLYNPIMLYEQNTCYLHAKCDEQKMIITKVSNFFERNFDYDPKEIINSSVTILMPPSIIKFHHTMFLNWIRDGKSNNQAYYQIKKIYPITKRGYLYPCFKFYKRFIQLNGDIDYVTMFKSNKQDEQLILINNDFQIEGITLSLHHKLKLHTGDYAYLKGINMLALMPMLIKYTRYCSFITENDQDFLENDDNRNYFKKQGTLVKGKNVEEVESVNILHDRKSLNLTNIKLYLPNDFQATLEYYKQLLNAKKMQPFDAIRQLYRWIRKDKNYSKFKAQICIREKQVFQTQYYQIQINELEQNNRLQKLKMSEQQLENGSQCLESNRQIEQNRLNQIDMQLFFSMSKKKNKVILFPSKNIFLKDENNRALGEIGHINNINIFIRISLIIFLTLVLAEMFIELNMVNIFNTLTNQYYQLSRYQKATFMLNTQYNIQHVQPGNSWEESFVIIAYTHTLIDNYNSSYFQSLIYDVNLNKAGSYPPYQLNLPTNLTNNRIQETYDQFGIFFKIYECAIALHRKAEVFPQNNLDIQEYYEFNNYIYTFHEKAQQIKEQIKTSFNSNYQKLRDIDLIFGFVIGIIVIGCLLFSVSRLWKVSNGFKQLVSILIQIDNNDMRDIIKYVDYTKNLFEHLNQKNQKMGYQNQTNFSSTSGNFRSFQKKSSEISEDEQIRLATSSANLNKKIKKIQIGQVITKMMFQPAIILLITITLIGAILLVLNIFSIISLDSYADFEQIGFIFMENNGVNNILASGAIEKYRGSPLYSYSKYQTYLNKSIQIQASNLDISMTLGTSALEESFKVLYFDNFCRKLSYVFNATLTSEFANICDSTNANWCSYLYQELSEDSLITRCETIQQAQLVKGVQNYDNFFLQQIVPFFSNSTNLTLKNIVEINDAYKLVDLIMFELMNEWSIESSTLTQSRASTIAIIVACLFLSTILLNIICIEYLVKSSLNQKYEIFRLMHEHYIPEWIIIKQKIIKVKLIKEGFMKQ